MKKKYCLILLIILSLTGCKVKEYTVTFNTDGGTPLESVKIEKGLTIEDIINPEKEGYIFVGWEKDGLSYDKKEPINEDTDLIAIWTEEPDLSKEYKVIFANGKDVKEVIVAGKDKVKEPVSPTLKYYKFAGWYDDKELYDFNTPVTKDLYLVAKFEKKIMNVTFDLDGGSGISERQIDAGKKLSRPDDPTKFGYKFVGWYYLGKEYNFDSIIEKNITLKAKWEPINYVTVRYETNSVTVLQSETVEKGKNVTKPADPTKDGYVFDYWSYNGVPFDFNNPIEESITLIAVYKEIEKEEVQVPVEE